MSIFFDYPLTASISHMLIDTNWKRWKQNFFTDQSK